MAEAGGAGSLQDVKILVVDDVPANLDLLLLQGDTPDPVSTSRGVGGRESVEVATTEDHDPTWYLVVENHTPGSAVPWTLEVVISR